MVLKMTPSTPPHAALVTGAASGIGRATARALAARGTPGLVVTDRDAAGLDALVAELNTLVPTLPLAFDVADEPAWERAEAQIRDRFGALSEAVVNAGIAESGAIADMTLERWRRTTAVNLDGAMLTIRTALRLMPPESAIVTVASVAALKAEPLAGAYCASKAGLLHLTRVAAREGAALGIRVNAICPGGTATGIWASQDWWPKLVASKGSHEAALAAMAVNTPLGRFAEPENIARDILHLLAPGFTTGAHLVADGGYSL